MSDVSIARRGCDFGLLRTSACTLSILAACTALTIAQGGLQKAAGPQESKPSVEQLRNDVEQLKSKVEKLEHEPSLTNDLRDIKNTLDNLKGTHPAPKEAWDALMIVGIVFVVIWGIVSWLRERTRQHETAAHERIALASAQTKADDAEVKARLDAIIRLLHEAQSDATKGKK